MYRRSKRPRISKGLVLYSISIVWFAWLALLPQPVQAADGVKLCNETSYALNISVAYQTGSASRSEGWQQILPGQCQVGLRNLPPRAQAFIYAVSDPVHKGNGLAFEGRERFCIASMVEDFELDGRRECRNRGYIETDFADIDLRGKLPSVTFKEAESFGAKKAEVAGIQRLLKDFGYDINVIDGFMGRKTEEALKDYRREKKLSSGQKNKALLQNLITNTQEAREGQGFRFCNKTQYLVWAAIGTISDLGFTSKGWLRIPAGQCGVAINEDLNERYYFTYAEAVDNNGNPVQEGGRNKIWGGSFSMCTKTPRFIIDGRDNCLERGFDEHGFERIDTGNAKNWTIELN